MNVIDHETYITDVDRAVDGEDFWTWTHPAQLMESEQFDEDMEMIGAGYAIWGYVERAEPGRAGAIGFPSGEALCWHETEGWTWFDEHGNPTELNYRADATPRQLAAFVRRRIGA